MKSPASKLFLESPQPVHRIPEQYISVALDTSQIMGGYWWDNSGMVKNGLGEARTEPLDLENEKLVFYTKLLHPKCIRFGGTEADRVYYALNKKNGTGELTDGYHYTLGRKRWKAMELFCRLVGSSLMLTVNAGPGPRHEKQRWRRKNARQLIKYSEDKKHDVAVWELGNEVNAYPFFHGSGSRISSREYAGDMKRLKRTISSKAGAMTAGPALAVWPVIGETLPFLKRFLRKAGKSLDIITWHYYPQQSSRSPFAIRRAKRKTMLKPSNLEEAARQAGKITSLRDQYMPDVEIWLGETGHAQCGGEPGLSDTFYSGFWWLDQLGIMAREGMSQVVRQTLTGGDYGLLDKFTHDPLPDFYTTLLWSRYVGPEVYEPVVQGTSRSLRFYLHSLAGKKTEGYCLIYINLSKETGICNLDDSFPLIKHKIFLTSPDIYSRVILMNGQPLTPEVLPEIPEPDPVPEGCARQIELPPLSYGFLLLNSLLDIMK